jgi:hypothetical protein
MLCFNSVNPFTVNSIIQSCCRGLWLSYKFNLKHMYSQNNDKTVCLVVLAVVDVAIIVDVVTAVINVAVIDAVVVADVVGADVIFGVVVVFGVAV